MPVEQEGIEPSSDSRSACGLTASTPFLPRVYTNPRVPIAGQQPSCAPGSTGYSEDGLRIMLIAGTYELHPWVASHLTNILPESGTDSQDRRHDAGLCISCSLVHYGWWESNPHQRPNFGTPVRPTQARDYANAWVGRRSTRLDPRTPHVLLAGVDVIQPQDAVLQADAPDLSVQFQAGCATLTEHLAV